jgi:hypothetical protein
VGADAYRLKMPDSLSIHPMVHISQLKLATGFKGHVSTDLPSELSYRVPVKVLSSRLVNHGENQGA